MPELELKLPPPLITLIAAALAWLASIALPQLGAVIPGRIPIAIGLGIAGLVLGSLGVLAFRQAATTIDPRQPTASTSLVTSGIYRVTRNPMYLGLVFLLLGWAVYLSNAMAFLVVPIFIAYMTRFQIVPEEQALIQQFPETFESYRKGVRRWL